MLRTITISDSVFELLDKEARRSNLSPNDLAERLLAERLSTDQQIWRARFADLLARVHEHTRSFNSPQIEADITAASSEVRAARRAGRRPA